MTAAWISLEPGWTLLQAETVDDGRIATSSSPAIGYIGPCSCRPVTVLAHRVGSIVEVDTAVCGCTGSMAQLLPPEASDEQSAAVTDRLTRQLVDHELGA